MNFRTLRWRACALHPFYCGPVNKCSIMDWLPRCQGQCSKHDVLRTGTWYAFVQSEEKNWTLTQTIKQLHLSCMHAGFITSEIFFHEVQYASQTENTLLTFHWRSHTICTNTLWWQTVVIQHTFSLNNSPINLIFPNIRPLFFARASSVPSLLTFLSSPWENEDHSMLTLFYWRKVF
jgi:hypothetical protein